MIPTSAIDLVKRWEGFHRVVQRRPIVMAGPYRCPAGAWTIGYGTVIGTPDHRPITEAEAERLLLRGPNGLGQCVLSTLRLCPQLLYEPENRTAAVASFVYNLGAGNLRASTLRRKINEKNWAAAEREFHKWVWAGGRKLPGLVARRAEEAALFAGSVT